MLLTHYANPPTITELSAAVGLNRTRLKAGFRDRFGTTIFGFIRAQRMQRALLLLRDGSQVHILDAILILSGNPLEAAAVSSVTLDTDTTNDTRRTK
ncbi:MAG: AraC family transcriptional regulator [Spirochaetaceae bacterium]|nr:MAG: AraC family transcriptional regulator [Spirochaetaceae bacterium]